MRLIRNGVWAGLTLSWAMAVVAFAAAGPKSAHGADAAADAPGWDRQAAAR